MKEINYNKTGEPVSDFEVEDELTYILNSSHKTWTVSNELIITALRVRIKENPELLDKVKVTVGDERKPFVIDKYGRSDDHHFLSGLWDKYLLELA